MLPTQYLAYIRYFVICFFRVGFQQIGVREENTRGLATFYSHLCLFQNISGKRLVGQSSKLVFFYLDLNVERMSKQFGLC